MNPFFSPLYLELPQPHVRSIGDTSLQCFFVERRGAGSVSPNTANQEESDQICLFHIWKSCSFQGESGETPSSFVGGITASGSQSSALTPPLEVLSPPPSREGQAILIVSWCHFSDFVGELRVVGIT